jgi:hypothetical protein
MRGMRGSGCAMKIDARKKAERGMHHETHENAYLKTALRLRFRVFRVFRGDLSGKMNGQ